MKRSNRLYTKYLLTTWIIYICTIGKTGKTVYITDRMGDESMLETPEERIKLLKAGITGNQIEELYILYNNFKVAGNPFPPAHII